MSSKQTYYFIQLTFRNGTPFAMGCDAPSVLVAVANVASMAAAADRLDDTAVRVATVVDVYCALDITEDIRYAF